jgi:hypothetical protein
MAAARWAAPGGSAGSGISSCSLRCSSRTMRAAISIRALFVFQCIPDRIATTLTKPGRAGLRAHGRTFPGSWDPFESSPRRCFWELLSGQVLTKGQNGRISLVVAVGFARRSGSRASLSRKLGDQCASAPSLHDYSMPLANPRKL